MAGYKRVMCCDIETYSSVDLIKSGVYAYVEAPDFEVLLFAYAFDDEPVQVVDFINMESLPQNVRSALFEPSILKTAFNANFERACLAEWFGCAMPPEQWSCTAVMARELGLPGRLEDVGAVIGLSEDKQKSKEGKALISFFSKPCKPTKVNGQRSRNLPEHAPEKWKAFIEYNRQDVVAERSIRQKLSKFSIVTTEQPLWCLDQKINDRGVMIDLPFVRRAIELDAQNKEGLMAEAVDLTGLANPKSDTQLKRWITEKTGIVIDSLEKSKIADVRDSIDNEDALRALDLRAGLSKTSNGKYSAMDRAVCRDGRIRGMTQFYGANRTGRWGGRIVQPQNLPQNKMPDEDLDLARRLVRTGDFETLECLFDNLPFVLSQLIRTAFIPRPGYRFIVADFSAIEARVIAWLAGEQWRMDVFNGDGKIYEASAERMFKLPPGSVGKGDPMRQKGKIAELALGFGGSVGALIKMGALSVGLTESELKPLVNRWRAANQAITRFWWSTGGHMEKCISTRAPQSLAKGIAMRMQGSIMRLRLPGGRELSYVKPRLTGEGITYEGTIQTTGRWGRVETYGPKIVENIVQATARDCLAEAITRCEQNGYPVVFHVHDEVILEVPVNRGSIREIKELLGTSIPWAPGLPAPVDAYECNYYKKD